MRSPLLDAEVVRELEALRRSLRVEARGGHAGTVATPRGGSAVEFEEHRPYGPGDDAARIDWLAFARTGQPVQKRHRADEDAVVRVVLETSGSLDFGTPKKLDVAARLAAALGYLALAAGERAQVLLATPEGVRPSPVRRGRGALASVLRQLSELSAEGPVPLEDALGKALTAARRPGLLVVISDFLDPSAFETPLARARFAGHEVLLVQVLSREELEPDLEGDLELEDSETGAKVRLTADAASLRAYRSRVEALFERLRALARDVRGGYVRVATDEPLTAAVRRILRRAVD